MNILSALWTTLPLLDMAPIAPVLVIGSFAVVVILLALFLALIGYLIWKTIQKKKKQ